MIKRRSCLLNRWSERTLWLCCASIKRVQTRGDLPTYTRTRKIHPGPASLLRIWAEKGTVNPPSLSGDEGAWCLSLCRKPKVIGHDREKLGSYILGMHGCTLLC